MSTVWPVVEGSRESGDFPHESGGEKSRVEELDAGFDTADSGDGSKDPPDDEIREILAFIGGAEEEGGLLALFAPVGFFLYRQCFWGVLSISFGAGTKKTGGRKYNLARKAAPFFLADGVLYRRKKGGGKLRVIRNGGEVCLTLRTGGARPSHF